MTTAVLNQRKPMGLDSSWIEALKDGLLMILSALMAYTVAMWRKPSHRQLAEAITPLIERIAKLETKAENTVTRGELRDAMSEIKIALADLKTDIRDLRRGE